MLDEPDAVVAGDHPGMAGLNSADMVIPADMRFGKRPLPVAGHEHVADEVLPSAYRRGVATPCNAFPSASGMSRT